MNRRDFLVRGAVAVGGAALLGHRMRGADAAPAGTFRTLRGNVSLFLGRGGTIGTLVTPSLALVVDTQFPDSVGACFDGVRAQAGREADLVINTHHHGDHTGGNGAARARGITRIVAHENVPRLQREAVARRDPPPEVFTANETFSQRWRLDAGDEVIAAEYFGPAHTGGDIITYFEKANVAHMGDLVFNRLHPFIDRPAGASVAGWAGVLEAAIDRYPADTVFIFGHGRANAVDGVRADLVVMRDYLAKLLEVVAGDIKAGRSLDQIRERTALAGFEDFEGGNRLARNLETAHAELTEGVIAVGGR